MKHSCFVRKIDELGRIVLPMELRQFFDIKEKDPLEISFEDNGILIKKIKPSCVFCSSNSNLKAYGNKNICKKCLHDLVEIK